MSDLELFLQHGRMLGEENTFTVFVLQSLVVTGGIFRARFHQNNDKERAVES